MARKTRAGRKGKGGLTIKWDEAEISKRIDEEGYFAFKVLGAEQTESQGGDDQIEVNVECTEDGKFEGAKMKIWFSLKPQALWKLAQFLEAVGIDVPEEEADLDLEEFEDKEFIGTVEEHEYKGDTNYRIQRFSPADEAEEEPDTKKKGAKADAKKGKGKAAAEEEEEEEEDEGDKKKAGRPKGSKNKAKEEPAAKKGKGKKELPKLTADEVNDMDEEALDDVVTKYDLEIDLSEAKTLRKKCAMVTDALEEAKMLDDE